MFCTQATMVCSFKRITLDLSHEQFNIFTPLAATGGKGKKPFHKGGKGGGNPFIKVERGETLS